MNITLEELTEKRIDDFESFMQQIKDDFLPMREPDQKKNVKEYCNGANSKMILATYGEKIIGYFAYKLEPDHQAQIMGMGVLQEFRRKGIAEKMGASAMQQLSTQNVKKIFARTWSGNVASRAILEKYGFRPYETIKNHRINGDDTILYVLKLTK